jgi:hypothetical protein
MAQSDGRFQRGTPEQRWGIARNNRLVARIGKAFGELHEEIAQGRMASNQLRLWFSAFAHLMLSVLRAEVLCGTDLAKATVGQIRLKLFKVAARVKVSCRRIHLELASGYPCRETFRRAWANLATMSSA